MKLQLQKEKRTKSSLNQMFHIRNKYMILINSKKINPLFLNDKYEIEKYLEEYENTLNYGYMECPCCSSTNLIKWGTYERNLIFFDNNYNCNSRIVKIKRIKCNGCGKTHSLLPDGLVPYKQYTLKTIIDALINNKNINEYVVKYWKKQFNKYLKPLLRTTFPNKNYNDIQNLINSFEERKLFLSTNNRYFMQIKIIFINYAYS